MTISMTISMTKKTNKKFNYPIFNQRLSYEMINWLNREKTNYKTWNKFFEELKKRFENN